MFLSYASEDRQAVRAIRDALPAFGLEVWYDESALDGGDAWDQKIRRQIRECDFFMPVISAQTEARPEGYFRREWRLAVERTLDMADDHTFLLPVVIDDTPEAGARVPERFLSVQWMRLPGGRPTPALEALCRRLVSGSPVGLQPAKRAPDQPVITRTAAAARQYPQFPREEAGQKIRFWFQVIGWALQSAWVSFNRLPRWVRILVYVWLGIALLSRGCSSSDDAHRSRASSREAARLNQVADNEHGSTTDGADLGAQIAREVVGEVGGKLAAPVTMLAIPFSAPGNDPAAQRIAESAFAQMYGKVAMSHHGEVGVANEPLANPDASAAAARGRTRRAKYVLTGAIDDRSAPPSLNVQLVGVADGSLLWSQSYPVAGADPGRIAADVDAKLQALEDH
ncbi:MAG TPA: toll/interleukin-1 receptor domain-containing protein [Steroidobacteraceae bacterium]|nr:toll/interleukin-1 receptor domain-containing protein [Steroidobacteraceae bacterium]